MSCKTCKKKHLFLRPEIKTPGPLSTSRPLHNPASCKAFLPRVATGGCWRIPSGGESDNNSLPPVAHVDDRRSPVSHCCDHRPTPSSAKIGRQEPRDILGLSPLGPPIFALPVFLRLNEKLALRRQHRNPTPNLRYTSHLAVCGGANAGRGDPDLLFAPGVTPSGHRGMGP